MPGYPLKTVGRQRKLGLLLVKQTTFALRANTVCLTSKSFAAGRERLEPQERKARVFKG